QTDVAVQGAIGVDDFALAAQVAVDGLGVAQLPGGCIAPLIERGSLVRLLAAWEVVQPEFLLIHPSRRLVPASSNSFAPDEPDGRTIADPPTKSRNRWRSQSRSAGATASTHLKSPGLHPSLLGSELGRIKPGLERGLAPRFSLILPDNGQETGRIGGLRTGFCRKINFNNNGLRKIGGARGTGRQQGDDFAITGR